MELQKNIKCVLFDFDKTLVNLNINYLDMRGDLKNYFKSKNLDSDFKPLISEIGRLSKYTSDEEKSISDSYDIIDKYEIDSIKNSKINEEVLNLYKKLITKNLFVVIITRNGEKVVKYFLKRFNLPVPNLISSRDSGTKLKPNLEQFEKIHKIAKFNYKEYLLIGDSYHDEELAKKIKISFIKVNENGELENG